MSDDNHQHNDPRLGMIIVIMIVLLLLYAIITFGFFEEPEEPEGIFVRLILFFKQIMLI